MSAFCSQCKVRLLQDAQFCQKCGAAISKEDPSSVVQSAAPTVLVSNDDKKKLAIFLIVVALIIAIAVLVHASRSGQATSDGSNPDVQVCPNEIPADPHWQSCMDHNYSPVMQQLRRASVNPISASHKEVVDLTIRDADEIYQIARDKYLKGYKEQNEPLSGGAYLQEDILFVAVGNAVVLLNKSNPDFTNNLAEYAVGRAGDARQHYESAAELLAAYSQRPDLSVRCETSIESLRQELSLGMKQISLVEHLDARSNPEEYYLRVNYGDMLISDVKEELACFEMAAPHAQNQRLSEEAENQKTQGSNPPAAESETPQGPAPVPVENSDSPAQPPSIAEINQQAIALWNQKRYSDAIPLFNQACSSGKADSCNRLGLMYDFGQGVVQDFSRAFAFYSKSCNAGSGAACYHLGILQQYQPGGAVCNSGAVALSLGRSCDMGIATSCSIVGYSYIHGCGVAKDTAKGLQLVSKGCSLGDYNACDGIK